ncbi:MAG: hypothetical protein ACOH5I_03660 [Oligoflexus sp.]
MSITAEKIENLVALLSSMRDLLTLIAEGLIEFEKILDAEEYAIQKSDLKTIEKIVPEKERLGSQIAKTIQQLHQNLELSFREGLLCRRQESKSHIELTDLIEALKLIEDTMDRSDLASQVILHLSPKIQKTALEVISLRMKLQPKIEANSYLVRRLLSHHQETYRFWQSLISEAESVYSSYGKTKSLKSQSILEVKT